MNETIELSDIEVQWVLDIHKQMADIEQQYKSGLRSIIAARGHDVDKVVSVSNVDTQSKKLEFILEEEQDQ